MLISPLSKTVRNGAPLRLFWTLYWLQTTSPLSKFVVFFCLFFYCNIASNIAVFSRNCNVEMLTCSFNFRRLFNFLADDGYEARNVLIKDVFYFCFCSPVYTETTQDSCKCSWSKFVVLLHHRLSLLLSSINTQSASTLSSPDTPITASLEHHSDPIATAFKKKYTKKTTKENISIVKIELNSKNKLILKPPLKIDEVIRQFSSNNNNMEVVTLPSADFDQMLLSCEKHQK